MHSAEDNQKRSKQSDIRGYILFGGIAIGGIYLLLTDPMFRQNIILFNVSLCGSLLCIIWVVSKLLGKAKEWGMEVEEKDRRKLFCTKGPLAPVLNILVVIMLGSLGISIIIYPSVADWLVGYLLLLGIMWGVIVLISWATQRKRNKSQ